MRPPRILVVDDDRFFRDLFRDALLQPGWEIVTAIDAATAEVELARGVDVLLTDLVMPGLSGIELCKRARFLDPAIEVVVVTLKDEVRSAVEAMQAGAGEYLVKPVERSELLLAVQRAIDRGRLRREKERLLGENLELARNQALLRRCLSLLSTLDAERVHELSMQVLSRTTDAQSGALWTADEKGHLVLRGFTGLVDRETLPSRIDPAGLEATGAPFALDDQPLEKAFQVPLLAGGEVQGLARLSDPLAGSFSEEAVREARAVADFAALAIRNARRFGQVERVGLRDKDTAAYNLSFFVDYASKEIYKARRYEPIFSLFTLSLDNLDSLRRSLSREDLTRLTRGLLGGISKITRDADVVAKVADNEFYILLPETDAFGAWMFRRRAREAARSERVVRDLEIQTPIALSFGLATYPGDGLDFDELLHRCRLRAEESRRTLLRRLQLEELDLWDTVDALLSGTPSLPADEGPGASRRGPLPRDVFLAMQSEAVRDLLREEASRGLLYVGAGPEGIHADMPALAALAGREISGRLYLLGKRGATEPGKGGATPVYLDGDERMASHELLLYLSEKSSYALIRQAGGLAFHTSDVPLVDHLALRLQERYDLQPV